MVASYIYLLDGTKLSISMTLPKTKDDANKKKKPVLTVQELYARILHDHIIETYLKCTSQFTHTTTFCIWVTSDVNSNDKGRLFVRYGERDMICNVFIQGFQVLNAQDNVLPIIEDIFSERKLVIKTKTSLEESVNHLQSNWESDETTVYLLALEVRLVFIE